MSNLDERVAQAVASDLRTLLEVPDVQLVSGSLADGLGRLFTSLLVDADCWSRYWWIDDAVPQAVAIIDDLTIGLVGLWIASDERHQWTQPFRAVLRLGGDRMTLASCRAWLGDAAVAIDAITYGARHPRHWPEVDDWTFTLAWDRIPA